MQETPNVPHIVQVLQTPPKRPRPKLAAVWPEGPPAQSPMAKPRHRVKRRPQGQGQGQRAPEQAEQLQHTPRSHPHYGAPLISISNKIGFFK